MEKTRVTTGLAGGVVDTEKREVRFSLNVAHGNPLPFVARFGVVSQIVSALARMAREMETIMHRQGAMETVAAEQVAQTHIQKDRWKDVVLMRLTTPQGVPYTFVLPTRVAADIADQLKTESAKPTETGNA